MDQAHSDGAPPKARRRISERLPESKILRETLLALSRAGGFVVRQQSGMLIGANGRRIRVGVVGMPDVVACVRGRYIAVECKGSSGRLSKNQRNVRVAIALAGGKSFVVKSIEDIAEMVTWLDGLP